MYTYKFWEHFEQYRDQAWQTVWSFVESNRIPPGKKGMKLARSVMEYIANSVSSPDRKPFIETNLMKIFQILVLPNIAVTDEEVDDFDDDPDSFVRNDLEEADLETRRRNCLKFVQRLGRQFSNQIAELVGSYIMQLLDSYNADRDANWKYKTSLLNLLVAVIVQHASPRLGVVDLTIPPEQLHEYLNQLVIPELQEQDINRLPVLKATCLKFIFMFRNQIPETQVLQYVELVYRFMRSDAKVNQSYAAACLDKLLLKKSKVTGQMVVTRDSMNEQVVQELLGAICDVLTED